MKKNLMRMLACGMAAACLLTLAACGNDNSSSAGKSSSSAVSSAVSSAAESSASSEAASTAGGLLEGMNENGKFDTIDGFVNSSLIQSQLSSLKESAGESGVDIDITGEDNKLVYTFTYGDLEDTDLDTLATALDSALETQASTFEGVAASLKEAVEVENPVVVVRYVTSDGEELLSREFAPTAE